MALRAAVPVVPCAMVGTFELQPPGRRIPRIGRVTIRFGKPLDFSRFAGLDGERYAVRSVTDEIMYEILALSGQEYVDRYAGDVKAEAKAEARAEQAQRSALARRRGRSSPS
jgi:1-acyl-sn-glycerol-3-phosphate acyltransferase